MAFLFWLVTAVLAAGIVAYFRRSSDGAKKKPVDLERFRKAGWFGVKTAKDSTEVRPFKVDIPESELNDLKQRLTNARYVDHIEDTQFTYGFNSNYLKQVVQYWKDEFDWRKQEAALNAFPQFKTQIEGLDIHFIRAKPTKQAKTVLPLLVIHGWPGSVLEYYKSFPLYTEPDDQGLAFEVIAPSIPGYGWSEAPHQTDFNTVAAARVFVKLMRRLGHERFLVHGGDWGNFITRNIAHIFPEHVIGAHICGNFDSGRLPGSRWQAVQLYLAEHFPRWNYFGIDFNERDHQKLFPRAVKQGFLYHEMGYYHIQSTKPDTVASGLVDSPVGLAAYILEKFSTWTNPAYRDREDGGLREKFTLDELLTNVSIYWFSGNIASSQRFYKENTNPANHLFQKFTVPFATVDTPYELGRTPRQLVEKNYEKLVQYSDFPRGGHFTAFEEPELVNEDIRAFVSKIIVQ